MNEVEKYRLSLYEPIKKIKVSDSVDVELVRNTLDGKKYVKLAYHSDKRGVFGQLKKVNSKYLPEIIDIFFSDDTIVIEEYIDGTVLSELIEGENLSGKTASCIVKDLLNAVDDLHNAGIVHRDIKPGNIMVKDNGHAVLIDFSIAKLYSPNLSKDTSMFGTIGYAPPEQYGFSQSDFRSDIYAIGITIKEIAEKIKIKRYVRLIHRCTEFDPNRRPKTISEVRGIERAGRLPVYLGIVAIAVTIPIVICTAYVNINRSKINELNIISDSDNWDDIEDSEKTGYRDSLVGSDSEIDELGYSRIMHIDDNISNYVCINVSEEEVIERTVSLGDGLENICMRIEKSDNTLTISIGDAYVQTFTYDKSISSSDYSSNGFHSDIILYDLNKDGLYEIIPLIADAYVSAEVDAVNPVVMLNGTMAWIVGYDGGFYTADGDIKSVMDRIAIYESAPNCIWGEFPKHYELENKKITERE